MPTIAGTFSVPARLPRSWAPPSMRFVRRMGRGGEQVDVVRLHVDGQVPHGLHCVRVEEDAVLAANRAELPDGLDGADLVVGKHHRDKAGVLPDGGFQLLGPHKPVLMHIQERHREALLLQRLQRMEHGVVLKGGGDDVRFADLAAEGGGGAEGLVVGLAPAGGEEDLPRFGVDDGGDIGAGRLQELLCPLADSIQARGVAEIRLHTGEHGVNGGAAHLCGGCVVCVYLHRALSLSFC